MRSPNSFLRDYDKLCVIWRIYLFVIVVSVKSESGRTMADGAAGGDASHTVIGSDVREGSHGRPSNVFTSLRGNRVVKR